MDRLSKLVLSTWCGRSVWLSHCVPHVRRPDPCFFGDWMLHGRLFVLSLAQAMS